MPELHLKQSGFTFKACRPFAKIHRIQKVPEKGNSKHLYRNELCKACFAHDEAYSDCKDVARRTISDKILKDRHYEITRPRKYDGYWGALASMVYRFFDKKTGSGMSVTTSWRITWISN